MLPALQLCDIQDRTRTFTRRPEWSQPLESLWGILSKWQFVNCLPYSTIAASIFSGPQTESYVGVDLRVLDVFKLAALAEYSGLSRDALAGGACSGSADSFDIAYASAHLRFCPSCMQEGFHATLYQFTPMVRCPIHDARLHEVCPRCCVRIPYRLNAAFAARPFACPLCAHPLLADPRSLMQPYRTAAGLDKVLKWQRYLAQYVQWYRGAPRTQRDDAGRFVPNADTARSDRAITQRLTFIGVLQQHVCEPPPLPLFGVPRASAAPSRVPVAPFGNSSAPSFSRQWWPHFHTKRFLTLCDRYSRYGRRRDQSDDSAPHRRATLWWRRSWDGAIARGRATSVDTFDDPPFGISEWLAFAPRAHALASDVILGRRFEDDLHLTWNAWLGIINHLGDDAKVGLHARLVPARACWLAAAVFEPEAPVLGFS